MEQAYIECGHLLVDKWALQNRKGIQKGKVPKCLITHENYRERERERELELELGQ
jgi:hypothetical protein